MVIAVILVTTLVERAEVTLIVVAGSSVVASSVEGSVGSWLIVSVGRAVANVSVAGGSDGYESVVGGSKVCGPADKVSVIMSWVDDGGIVGGIVIKKLVVIGSVAIGSVVMGSVGIGSVVINSVVRGSEVIGSVGNTGGVVSGASS